MSLALARRASRLTSLQGGLLSVAEQQGPQTCGHQLFPPAASAVLAQVRGAKAASKGEQRAGNKASSKQDPALGDKLQRMMKMFEPQEVPKQKLSPEEREKHKQIAKEYSRRKMEQHRAWQARLTTKINLKLAAIEALPAHLQEHARTPDYSPVPTTRWIPTHTPPIPGYVDTQSQQEGSRRRR